MSPSHQAPVFIYDYGHHSKGKDVGCTVFMRLYSVEKLTGLLKRVFWESKLLEVRRRPAAGRATEEVWMKWSPDCKCET